MSHKRNEALRHVQHSMHHVIAAGEGSDRAPDSCKLCPYYRPDFKFRTCLYAHCPYKKQVNVFRSTPEKWDMQERIDAATARYHELGDSIKATETRMAEIAVLRTHIVNYARTRPVYDAYRKAGYSKRFLDTHREEITLHKAAKTAFDEAGLKKLPKAKDLSIEYAELLKKKKEAYPDYRKARDEMQELMKAQKNVEMFFAEEKSTTEKGQAR